MKPCIRLQIEIVGPGTVLFLLLPIPHGIMVSTGEEPQCISFQEYRLWKGGLLK